MTRLQKLKASIAALRKRIISERALVKRTNAAIAKNRAKLARRRKAVKNLSGGERVAVHWALAQVGTVEHPANSNRGPKIDDWEHASGYPGSGVPWCQCFANAVAQKGGAPQLHTGYTPAVYHGTGSYTQVPVAQRRPGDFVFFKWPGVSSAPCDHVGVYVGNGKTVEGNTSAGNAGSQNNGGGVFLRDRGLAYVVSCVRPPYPS